MVIYVIYKNVECIDDNGCVIYYYLEEVEECDGGIFVKEIGEKIIVIFLVKMFKLKNNVVDLLNIIFVFGVDIVCWFVLFDSLFECDVEWIVLGVEVVVKYLVCVYCIVFEIVVGDDSIVKDDEVLFCMMYKVIYEVS